jgi:hypothetical protein
MISVILDSVLIPKAFIIVMDLTAEHGFNGRGEAVAYNAVFVTEVRERTEEGMPIVIFATKFDLVFTRFWEKVGDIFMSELFSESRLGKVNSALTMNAEKANSKKKSKNVSQSAVSLFEQFPRELTLNIIFTFVCLLRFDDSDQSTWRNHTQAYRDIAQACNVKIFFGSGLRNQGVNEVFEEALRMIYGKVHPVKL